MASKSIGIEIGSDTLKMTVVQGSKVLLMAAERLPDHLIQDGRVLSPETMSSFIKQMRKNHHIPGGQCAMVLPPQFVIGLQLSLPVMKEEELLLNLPFEFHDYVGKGDDVYNYDYIIRDVHDNIMDIYAVAVRHDLVEEYWNIFKKAGLDLKVAIPQEMAWLNLIGEAKDVPEKLAIVDIGHNSTRINIFDKDNFVMGKGVEFAGQLFDETIAAEMKMDPHAARSRKEGNIDDILNAEFMQQPFGAVAIEVMRTVSFYNYSLSPEQEPLKDVYFCGGSANIEILRTAITNATELNLHPIDQLLNTKDDDASMALRCALCVGAAIQLQ